MSGEGDMISLVPNSRGAAFPQHPFDTEFDDLAVRSDEASKAAAVAIGPQLQLADLLDGSPEALLGATATAIAARPTDLNAHLVGHDGVDERVVRDGLSDDVMTRVAAEGGGLVLSNGERYLSQLRRAHLTLSVAWQAPVFTYVLVGNDQTRILDRVMTECMVVPISSDIIVHPQDRGPFDVAVGTAGAAQGSPRVTAPAGAVTVVFGRLRFGSAALRSVLVSLAPHHPLLRLDVPLDPDGPVTVYGATEPADYYQLVQQQTAAVRLIATDERAQWWWTLSHPLTPLPPTTQLLGRSVTGWFPGGIGVLGSDDDGSAVLLRTAGVTVRVPTSSLDLLGSLLSGAPVTCTESNELSLRQLAQCGVITSDPDIAAG